LAKLDSVLPDEQRHEASWARRTLLATGMHRADLASLAPILEKLRQAAREHRRVRMAYHSLGQPEPVQREIDPYALVHRWGWWYAIGYCHLRQGLRTFRLDRIRQLILLETVFDLPADFNLQDYLEGEPQAQTHVIACLRLTADARRLALDSHGYWETVEPQPDGSALVTFPAPNLEWAASTALAYGPLVEVVDPPELRRMVRDWAAAVDGLYMER
ncbi:MAG: helix-turn-helix transcriptional regulator, partial [Anaerolineales bacterium]